MYEIKIKGMKEPFMVEDDKGKELLVIYSDDRKYPESQKIGIKNWVGTKGEIKTIFHIKQETLYVSNEIQFSDSDLKIFEKDLFPFTERRPIPFTNDGSMFDYLTCEGEILFLEKHNIVEIEDRSNIMNFRVKNPIAYFSMRNKIEQLHKMNGRYEYAEKKRLQQLEEMAESIGILPL